jgi:hypothetical protein
MNKINEGASTSTEAKATNSISKKLNQIPIEETKVGAGLNQPEPEKNENESVQVYDLAGEEKEKVYEKIPINSNKRAKKTAKKPAKSTAKASTSTNKRTKTKKPVSSEEEETEPEQSEDSKTAADSTSDEEDPEYDFKKIIKERRSLKAKSIIDGDSKRKPLLKTKADNKNELPKTDAKPSKSLDKSDLNLSESDSE